MRGAIELAHALGVDRVVTMSGCPGSRDGGQTPVFAPWALTPDDESLWEWQLEQRLAPFWRELCGVGRGGGARRAHLPRAAPGRVGVFDARRSCAWPSTPGRTWA